MSKMKELYEKVAADNTLQEKFAEITKNAEADGEEVSKEKIVSFAKEAGYDVTIEEMQIFFNELVESTGDTLSDLELDQVAGGKSRSGITTIVTSVATFGFGCGFASAGAASVNNDWGDCKKMFE